MVKLPQLANIVKYLVKFANMKSESQYLTDKSVLKRVVLFALIIAIGVICWTMFPREENAGLWCGLAFMTVGLMGVVSNIVSSCWYPVLSDECIVLRHYLLPSCKRTVLYAEILYAKVGEFQTRRYGLDLVLTLRLKDGKKLNFVLMTSLDQIDQLKTDILSRGVPDTFDPQAVSDGEKKYLSVRALVLLSLLSSFLLAFCCWSCIWVASPLMIVLVIMFIPLVIFLMNLLSYVVVDGSHIRLKYLIFKSKNLEINVDDIEDADISPGGHFSVRLKTLDNSGRTRYTRLVGLVSIDMIQEINAYIEYHRAHMSGQA